MIQYKEKDLCGKSDERRKDELVFSEDTAAEATDEGRFSVWGTSTDVEYGGGDSKLVERPKLNLKPRSQQLGAGGATIGSRSWIIIIIIMA